MIAALATLLLGGAIAHPMAPSHVVIDLAQGTVVSTHERGVKAPVLSAPLGCTPVDEAAVVDGESIVVRLRWQCLAAPTGPVVLRPEVDAPPVIVEVHAIDGTQTIVLDAAHPVVDLSRPETGALATLLRWTWIGAEHLWGGLDHLFLVLALFFRGVRINQHRLRIYDSARELVRPRHQFNRILNRGTAQVQRDARVLPYILVQNEIDAAAAGDGLQYRGQRCVPKIQRYGPCLSEHAPAVSAAI